MKTRLLILISIIMSLFNNCTSSKKTNSAPGELPAFYKVGHRGTRGLMPENSIPAMLKAIELGANVIEFDVHVTKDNKVIVYHDPLVNADYTTFADGRTITKEERENLRPALGWEIQVHWEEEVANRRIGGRWPA